jgi:hypothetical protein
MGWVRVEKPREILGFQDGKTVAVLDLQVSTAADLPSLGDLVENYIVAAGSCAQIVRASSPTFVTLDGDDGNWYPDQSSASANAASQLSLGKTVVKPAVAVPESFEPDELEQEQTETEQAAEPEGGEEDAELL